MYRIVLSTVAALLLIPGPALCGQETAEKEAPPEKEAKKFRQPDVVYVPTPQDVVERMLKEAKVTKKDLVYDLGCGDGRIVVTAAKKHKCHAVGFEIHPERVKLSLANVKKNKVEKLVQIKREDIFKLDLSKANVITLYLLPSLNVKLIPQLKKLKPGSRIVSHDFSMAGVKPDKKIRLRSKKDRRPHTIYLWTTPLKIQKDDTPAVEIDETKKKLEDEPEEADAAALAP